MTEKNLSIPDVARVSGIADSTIRSMISRKNKTVALEVAFKLSAGLGVPVERLNGETLEQPLCESIANNTIELSFNDDVKQLARQYFLLSDANKELIKSIITSLAEKQ